VALGACACCEHGCKVRRHGGSGIGRYKDSQTHHDGPLAPPVRGQRGDERTAERICERVGGDELRRRGDPDVEVARDVRQQRRDHEGVGADREHAGREQDEARAGRQSGRRRG
jgi:hypothetical protein